MNGPAHPVCVCLTKQKRMNVSWFAPHRLVDPKALEVLKETGRFLVLQPRVELRLNQNKIRLRKSVGRLSTFNILLEGRLKVSYERVEPSGSSILSLGHF